MKRIYIVLSKSHCRHIITISIVFTCIYLEHTTYLICKTVVARVTDEQWDQSCSEIALQFLMTNLSRNF